MVGGNSASSSQWNSASPVSTISNTCGGSLAGTRESREGRWHRATPDRADGWETMSAALRYARILKGFVADLERIADLAEGMLAMAALSTQSSVSKWKSRMRAPPCARAAVMPACASGGP